MQMNCTFQWHISELSNWQEDFSLLRQSSLLQSYDYAAAVSGLYGQRPRWAYIYIDGQKAGMMQIMEAKMLGGLFHGVILDRGPLWFDGYGDAQHMQGFAAAFCDVFPSRIGRRRRWMPEFQGDLVFTDTDWQRADKQSYQTPWLDLTKSTEDLMQSMRKSWRQSLRKSEGNDLEIEWTGDTHLLPVMLKYYMLDRAQKGYSGPDVKILQALADRFSKNGALLMGFARQETRIIAGIMILCHGQSATYQVGWQLPAGRTFCAHHRLLWDGALYLKHEGVKSFDLGGVNDGTAEMVKRFKNGMGGKLHILPGLYT